MRCLAVLALAVLFGGLLPRQGSAQQTLVADISEHLVAITAGFSGTEVLLFGATDQIGDVVVIVRGPSRSETVHRKSRVLGVWANTASMTFERVPSYFGVAASGPLEELAAKPVLQRHEMGIEFLNLKLPRAKASPDLAAQWRDAFVRNKQKLSLYAKEPEKVTFLGANMFRTRMFFPANVPTGGYQVTVFLLREGQVVAAQTTPLYVSKVGLEAEVFNFAHQQSALYGILAILVAILAGWLANAAFRKS